MTFFYMNRSSSRIICWHKSSVDIEQNCHFYLQSFFTKKTWCNFCKKNYPWNHITFEFLLHRHQNWIVPDFSLNAAYFSNKNLHRKKNLSKVGNTDWYIVFVMLCICNKYIHISTQNVIVHILLLCTANTHPVFPTFTF